MFSRDETGAAILGGVRLSSLFEPEQRGGSGFSTPAYVYDLDAIAAEARSLGAAFGEQPYLIAYAVKANSAGPVLRALRREGVGADVVSGAELSLALACGMTPEDIVYSGVAKLDSELDLAISAGERGILSIQVESVEEIPRIQARAHTLGRKARVSLRVNPGIEADTHAHIATGHDEAKFGIVRAELSQAMEAVLAAPDVALVGLSTHIGSQLTDTSDYVIAARMLISLASACEATALAHGRAPFELLDFGGGFGIDYGSGCPVRPGDFARCLVDEVKRTGREGVRVLVEPGRSLVAAHGVLCASTVMTKRAQTEQALRHWLMIDAGMNDLLRPALYQALHRIEPIDRSPPFESESLMRVVGPVCESSDDFGTHPMPSTPPQRVVIRDAGAYGFTMSSEYNGRALPSEIFLGAGRVQASIRPRNTANWVRERLADEAMHFVLGKSKPEG